MRLAPERLDGAITEYVGDVMPGASLLAARGGFIYEKAYGYRDEREKIPAETGTKYMAASITKQFTAAAVVKLASHGLLALDDALSGYFPELPNWKESVTIRDMLNHSSGIPDYFDADFLEKCAGGDISPDDDSAAMSVISSYRKLKFVPKTEHLYSNSGYVLLGKIVEKVSGRSFPDFARDELLIPSGMNDSVFMCSGKRPEGAAKGYSSARGRRAFSEEPFNRVTAGWADGNLCTTARDLYRWHEALLKGSVVCESEQEQMYSQLILPGGRKTGAGFGLFIGERGGLREIWHTGSIPGYLSRFSRFPALPDESSAAVILLCNVDSSCFDTFNALFGRLTHILLEDVMTPGEKAAQEPYTREEIAGRYISALDENLTCEVSQERTEIRAAGTPRGFKNGIRAVYSGTEPCSGEAFFRAADGSDIIISFMSDTMTINDIGRTIYLRRVNGE
jgi:CubicO group peptidase (beta-lactamase class C family)